MVEFCPKCDNMLKPEKSDEGRFLVCTCGYRKKAIEERGSKKPMPHQKAALIKKTVVLDEKNIIKMPTTDVLCPKCGHGQAEYFQHQTRSADEPPTTFYRCVKCDHRWREY